MIENKIQPLGNELLEGLPKYINPLRLSASRLASFDKHGPKTLTERINIESEAIDFGSLVDDIVSEKDLKGYLICDVIKPTASLLVLAERLLEIKDNFDDEKIIFDKIFVCSQAKNLNLWSNIKKEDTLINKFDTDDFWDYINIMTSIGKRTLIPTELFHEANDLASIIKCHDYTNHIFNLTSSEELLYQVKAEFEYNNFNFLSYLDMVKIDHSSKTIKGIDLKTGSGNASEFITSFIKYRYYIQGALYLEALKTILIELGLENYKILPFEFLYVGRFEKQPLLYIFTHKWKEASFKGFKSLSGYNYKGINQLLEEVDWHVVNSVYNQSKDIYESNGIINIDDNFIKVNE